MTAAAFAQGRRKVVASKKTCNCSRVGWPGYSQVSSAAVVLPIGHYSARSPVRPDLGTHSLKLG